MRLSAGVKFVMRDICRLSDMERGETARVCDILADGRIRRRLQDMGIVEGTKIECLQKSPLGDPIAFLIRGAVVALRSEDSDYVLIER